MKPLGRFKRGIDKNKECDILFCDKVVTNRSKGAPELGSYFFWLRSPDYKVVFEKILFFSGML